MISIVDDDESVREATKGLVRALGYNVTTYASAEDFLSSSQVNETSCVITDVQMPGVSGVELQSRLKTDGNSTPVIFITAFPDEGLRTRVLAAGAFGYLSKPFNEECLIDCLDNALKNHSRDNTEQ
jgi:FixJ family two-component response regulator